MLAAAANSLKSIDSWILAGIGCQLLIDVFDKAAVVKIAFGVFEIAFQKLFVEPFRKHVKSQRAPVQ